MTKRPRPESLKRLRELIQARFKSQGNFAAIIKRGPGYVSMVLNGRQNFGPRIAAEFAEGLGMEYEDFVARFLKSSRIDISLLKLVRLLYDNIGDKLDHRDTCEYIAEILLGLNVKPDQLPDDLLFRSQIRVFMFKHQPMTVDFG